MIGRFFFAGLLIISGLALGSCGGHFRAVKNDHRNTSPFVIGGSFKNTLEKDTSCIVAARQPSFNKANVKDTLLPVVGLKPGIRNKGILKTKKVFTNHPGITHRSIKIYPRKPTASAADPYPTNLVIFLVVILLLIILAIVGLYLLIGPAIFIILLIIAGAIFLALVLFLLVVKWIAQFGF
jgi:hypothetical protein